MRQCRCGNEIPAARLRAVPNADRCISCQKEFERAHPVTPSFAAIRALAECSEMTLHEYFG